MSLVQNPLHISKLDAARRQLETAITLWFNGDDPVSIHTLAFATYEIIHTISKKRDPNRRDLLFDTLNVKDEYRSEFNIFIKKNANFFKHGDKDGEAVIEFRPVLTDLFLLYGILGLEFCGERKGAAELAFMWWFYIHKPNWLTESGRKLVSDNIPPDGVAHLRTVDKADFHKAFQIARSLASR
jgi:hypothetical protein